MAEIENHLPIVRIHSIDECVCRLDREEARLDLALTKAREIKAGIARNIGPTLRSSIGIASSPLLAKLAAELKKPDGLVAIEPRDLPDALETLPLRAIPGVGEGMAKRLERAGVKDFTSLWQLPPKHARAIWGSVVGERFSYALKGYDVPVEAPGDKSMIGHSRVLSPQHQRPEEARIVARALLLKAASRLRYYKLHASRLSLAMRIRPAGWIQYEAQFTASQNSWRFLRELDGLWSKATTALRHSAPRRRIGTVSIDLHGLCEGGPEPDLFEPVSRAIRDRRETELWSEIDALNRLYRRQMIMLASHRDLDLNYLGVKIAFSRVPDKAEFHC